MNKYVFCKGDRVVFGPNKMAGRVYKNVGNDDTLVSVEVADLNDGDDRPFLYFVTKACVSKESNE